jgi:spore maturation protein CgeB
VKVLCVFGQYNYGDRRRGSSYEYANFLPALARLGHDVIFFESWDKSAYTDFAQLNAHLLKTVQRYTPEVVLFVLLNYEIWIETLDALRRRCDAVLLNWAPDDSWKYEQSSRFLAPHFDVHATTYRKTLLKAKQEGLGNVVLTQWAASTEALTKPASAENCRYQVSFVGTAYGNRRKWIKNLASRGISVECFGSGWNRGPVRSEEIPEIIRNSIISLNFADSGLHIKRLRPYRSRQIKARVFEVAGAGGMLMTQVAPGLDEFFLPNKEIVVFEDVDDLADKIGYYLTHPAERDSIAQAGYERARGEHTYEHRFRRLFEQIERMRSASSGRRKCDLQTEEQGLGRFEEAQRAHHVGFPLTLVRTVLVTAATLVFGRQRGARAARRLVYELSWRLRGNYTYTAAGLPGRLFYRES